MRLKRRRTLRTLSHVVAVAAIGVFATGIIVSLNQHSANVAAGEAGIPRESDRSQPDTKKPPKDEFDNYTVAKDLPRYLFIPKFDVKAMVKHVGTTENNRVGTPTNIHDTGWYDGSAKPGEQGAMLVGGHVSAPTAHGVFYYLKNLEPSDKIIIERGDGKKLTYRVVKSHTYSADSVDMNAALSPVTSSTPGLNLITCAGRVIEGTDDFDQRLVVFAEQVDM